MSTYIKLSTLEYPRHIGDIQIDPAGEADYAPVEWVEPPEFNPARERCNITAPTKQGDAWLTTWEIVQIPDSEEAVKVRAERNAKLAECDWTQLADAPVDQAAWSTYRQDLRDITLQSGFPWDIQWPSKPE